MPCGVSLKGVIYKMKFYCIATWIQRGHIILMQNVFNNIFNLLNQFLPENTEWEWGKWAGNQVMWPKHHLNFPSQGLMKAGKEPFSERQGFQKEETPAPQPGQCGAHLFKHSIVKATHFPRPQMQIFGRRKPWNETRIWLFLLPRKI